MPGNYSFQLNNDVLEVIGEYKYLDVLFSRSGSFHATKKHLASQAEKTMYSVIKKSRSLLLPLDLQFKLFDKLVKPILLYGSEVYGFGTFGCSRENSIKKKKKKNVYTTVIFISFRTDGSGQTVHTQIRLLLEEHSDQGLHCLPFRLYRLDSLLYGRAT